MNKLKYLNPKGLNFLGERELSHIKGGRREIIDTYKGACETMSDLQKDGRSPQMHKLADGRYCIEW